MEAPKVKDLPKNIIDIKALNALNKSTHTEGPVITSVEFHPTSTVALVAGVSGVLSLFQVFKCELFQYINLRSFTLENIMVNFYNAFLFSYHVRHRLLLDKPFLFCRWMAIQMINYIAWNLKNIQLAKRRL